MVGAWRTRASGSGEQAGNSGPITGVARTVDQNTKASTLKSGSVDHGSQFLGECRAGSIAVPGLAVGCIRWCRLRKRQGISGARRLLRSLGQADQPLRAVGTPVSDLPCSGAKPKPAGIQFRFDAGEKLTSA